MITTTGNIFSPSENSSLCLDDVAIPLSKLTRWGGTARDWTVLDHSILVYNLCWDFGYDSDSVLEAALFHDAHEFVLGDIPRTWKPVISGYAEAQLRVQAAIEAALGLRHPNQKVLEVVKEFDDMALAAEGKVVLPPEFDWVKSTAYKTPCPQIAVDITKLLQNDRYKGGVDFIELFKFYSFNCRDMSLIRR